LETKMSFCRAGKVVQILNDHQHFVQGVAWDPAGKFIASFSSDRTCRIYARQPASLKSKKRKTTVVENTFTCRQVLAKVEAEVSQTTTTTDTNGKAIKVSFCFSIGCSTNVEPAEKSK
jgi:chromatin assembly factor 1 subunit B